VAREYYVFFPQIPLARPQLADKVQVALRRIPARFTELVSELTFDPERLHYRATGQGLTCRSLQKGVASTMNWQGLSFRFELPRGTLFLLLLNDNGFDQTTLVIRLNSTLFVHLDEHPAACETFKNFLLQLAEDVQASFLDLLCDPDVKTITEADVLKHLEVGASPNGDSRIIFLAIHNRVLSVNEVASTLLREFEVGVWNDYTVVVDKEFGVGPKD
jgi:hypothetical protein